MEGGGHHPRFTIFSKLYVTFILKWIAIIFGRDEEGPVGMSHARDNSHFLHYILISPDIQGLPFGYPFLENPSIMLLGIFLVIVID